MDCKKIQQVIYRFIYGESNTLELRRIKAHLEQCSGCQQEKLIIEEILIQLKDESAPEECPGCVKDRMLDGIKRKLG